MKPVPPRNPAETIRRVPTSLWRSGAWVTVAALSVACATGSNTESESADNPGSQGSGTENGPATTGAGGSGSGGRNVGATNTTGTGASGGLAPSSGSTATGGATNTGNGGSGAGGGGQGGNSGDSPGALAFELATNNAITDDLHRVRWHPSGQFAILLGQGGQVARYDVGGTTTLIDTLGKKVEDLDVSANGEFFLVVGINDDDAGQMWRVNVDAALQLTIQEETSLSAEPRAIERGENDIWAIGAYNTDTISVIQLWEDGSGITNSKSFFAASGLWDLMWADPSIYSSDSVITSHGINGGNSQSYILTTDTVVSNNYSSGFGNAAGAAWRPQGSYGYLMNWSSNKLYVFDGSWSSHTLPGVANNAAPQRARWNSNGTRALIVGRAQGTPLSGTVIDHRAGTDSTFSDTDLVNQSIPNFDGSPWFATTSTYLLDVDWRPASACTEGLIVGSDNNSGSNPTFGLVVLYYDTGDPDCP